MKNRLVIAVDGYSSCGKSTFAKSIAKELGYVYIDSGAMYRAVALYGLRHKFVGKTYFDKESLITHLQDISIDFRQNDKGINVTMLNGENVENEIRGVEIAEYASNVSKIKEIRAKLVSIQQALGTNGGIVMDGRDIGTVVFPEADLKIFMTARPEIRAQRRYDELMGKGYKVNFQEVLKNILERDYQDSNREESPLRKADDAIELDNSELTPEEQMIWFKTLMKHYQTKKSDEAQI